jgi:hypothetical protein
MQTDSRCESNKSVEQQRRRTQMTGTKQLPTKPRHESPAEIFFRRESPRLPVPRHPFPVPGGAAAFTLVEMLIAMALTLILVYAIASFYAIVGDAVKDGRSMIEMNQQLRAVAERLKDDLDRVTVPITPWADEGGAAGYFWIKEGGIHFTTALPFAASDWDINANNVPDAEVDAGVDLNGDGVLDVQGVDFDGNGVSDFQEPNVTNLLGDCDDLFGATIRAGTVPFTGQRVDVLANGHVDRQSIGIPPGKIGNQPRTSQITAPFAEVVWWTSFIEEGSDTRRSWDLREPRQLHRRQLLIRPDLNLNHGDVPQPYFCKIPFPPTPNDASYVFIYDLQQFCDVSIRPDWDLTAAAMTASINSPPHVYFVANSLADLAKRENRFMHQNAYGAMPLQPFMEPNHSFPYALDLNPNYAGTLNPSSDPQDPTTVFPRHRNTTANPDINQASLFRWVLFDGGRKGEDVMISNLLAFDIRVFDPEAVVRSDLTLTQRNSGGVPSTALQPGDPGYLRANSNQYTGGYEPFEAIGTGAYVDLGYGYPLSFGLSNLPVGSQHRVPTPAAAYALLFTTAARPPYSPTLGASRFFDVPAIPAALTTATFAVQTDYRARLGFTYDTWTTAYERDGINQDGDQEFPLASPTPKQLYDEGTDGIDNVENAAGLTRNGVDDVQERETTPPYSHPLRGVQIRVRIYEPGTRQMRQATVEHDFITE